MLVLVLCPSVSCVILIIGMNNALFQLYKYVVTENYLSTERQ